jgi:hypothetical protein
VIYQAWDMGLIPSEEERDKITKDSKRTAQKVLNQTCQHDRKFKTCFECYFGVAAEEEWT